MIPWAEDRWFGLDKLEREGKLRERRRSLATWASNGGGPR